MANYSIETMLMRPSVKHDCNITHCLPSIGGVCAFVPATNVSWCCRPYSLTCWRPAQRCNRTLAGQTQCISSSRPNWCCNSDYELCPPEGSGAVCTPLGYVNPARFGPAWGDITPGMVHGTPYDGKAAFGQPRERAGLLVGMTVGVVVLVAMVGAVGYGLWRERPKGKGMECVENMRQVERTVETGPVEAPENAVTVMHELDAVEYFEIDAEREVGELGTTCEEGEMESRSSSSVGCADDSVDR